MGLVWALIVILFIVLFFVPKKLSLKENLIMFPFIGYFAAVSHVVVGLMLDYVDFGYYKKVEVTDLFLVMLTPSLIGLLFLNLVKNGKFLRYVIIWTILSFLIESAFSLNGYMKHLEWKLWYSIPVYFMAFFTLHWFFYRVVRKSRLSKG
ncbi:hypothetical protein CN378_19045 [Bacillus sp. AFS015802]|nr:hypothetical protein CN378_19045 [Bacillus sp. AFS015802]